jgi:hypothetical protein
MLLLTQAAAEYLLITARQGFVAIRDATVKVVTWTANLVSTPRGVLIAAVLVGGLLLSLGRKRRW